MAADHRQVLACQTLRPPSYRCASVE